MEKTLEEIEREIEEKKNGQNLDEIYTKTKAETEVKETSMIIQDPSKALSVKLSQKMSTVIDQSAEVDKKVDETTQLLVDKGLEEQKNKVQAKVIDSENDILTADFKKNKDEYMYHGIDHKIDKEWKRQMIHIINDIWFVIWGIVSCFTIVPISTFLSRIAALKGFMKWVAIFVGVGLLLACLGGLTYACLKWCGVDIP